MFELSREKRDKMWARVLQLEEDAKRKYLDAVDWNFVIETLGDAEQKEYENLLKKLEVK